MFHTLRTTEGFTAFGTTDCAITETRGRLGFREVPADLEVDTSLIEDELVSMTVTSGFPGWNGSTWEWSLPVAPHDDDATVVQFRHFGFESGHDEDAVAFTAQTWALFHDRLDRYIKSGVPEPYFTNQANEGLPLPCDILTPRVVTLFSNDLSRPARRPMAIDFTLAPEHELIRTRVRDFIQGTVIPAVARPEDPEQSLSRREYLATILDLREQAKALGLWLPHMPKEWGGMGLGHVELAMVQAEAGKTRVGPWVLNCMAPDEGNMHTLLHWANDDQKERYLRPLCEGKMMSCFAMTEPEVAGSDPTLIQTHAQKDGDEWIINGHKWFISNARRAQFAILIARTELDVPEGSSGATTAFIIDIPSEGWDDVREVETMHGSTGHSEIVIHDLRVGDAQILGGRGNGHRLGQARLGPARLAHCMRWIAQAETALDMMVDRSIHRYSHGSTLAEKQGVQWMIADSAMELYQCKLMVLHAAYKIDRGDDFRTEVSMTKHFVANSLNRIVDRAIQVHGALGYSTDTPLANMLQHARWARLADGADEIHQMRIAERTIAAFKDTGSTSSATGGLPI